MLNGKVKTHYVHQMVAREWVLNPHGKRCVDHIDGDKTNNHRENLRYATHTENSRNMKIRANTSSIYKGVCMATKSGKWKVHIRLSGELKHLGYFADEREAAEAYNAAATEHFKAFARLNGFSNISTSEREAAEAALSYLR